MKVMTMLLATSLLISSAAWAQGNSAQGKRTYEVKVTNLTKGQSFTPLLAATHSRAITFFKPGQPASGALADLAEGGATGPLEAWLQSHPQHVLDTTTTMGLLGPGETVVFVIEGNRQYDRFSMAGMLLPTNDTFVAMNAMPLPKKSASRFAIAFDAGTEENDELCANIPGPTCMGAPFSDGQAEGYVYVSNGIHGNGDLSADDYDWRNPVAHVSITRVD